MIYPEFMNYTEYLALIKWVRLLHKKNPGKKIQNVAKDKNFKSFVLYKQKLIWEVITT